MLYQYFIHFSGKEINDVCSLEIGHIVGKQSYSLSVLHFEIIYFGV